MADLIKIKKNLKKELSYENISDKEKKDIEITYKKNNATLQSFFSKLQ